MSADASFLPGLELSRVLYAEAVRPILDEAYPGLNYAAARVGAGSEVLGFDTERSSDHEWGPRLDLFLTPEDATAYGADIRRLLSERLPKELRGWPTHFVHGDPSDPVGHMTPTTGPINHRVGVSDVPSWMSATLGCDPSAAEPTVQDWLAMPQQKLAEATEGAVFHDEIGALTLARQRLAWYPDQVWRYLMACQWQRISQEEAFVGRCAEVGDELGSAVVAARLVRDLMRLCLLLARRYAPYSKWLGSAFARLPVAADLAPTLRNALAATDYPTREQHLCDAYETVAALQNAVLQGAAAEEAALPNGSHQRAGLAAPVDPTRRPYHGRPFLVLHAERFARALMATVTAPEIRALPLIGAVDQWSDSTDLIGRPVLIRAPVTLMTLRATQRG